MPRAIILVLDSVGVGGAPDAERYGDAGSDTVGHVADRCARGAADLAGVRAGPLRLPNLVRRGLGEACRLATGRVPPGLEHDDVPVARYGCAAEISRGKDTPSGHWELAGVPVAFEWGYFPDRIPCFPIELVEQLREQAQLAGILGSRHASGTQILMELGEEHMRSGWPICYTSADSVFQIAAHEETFGLGRLYEVCVIARRLVDTYNIGRVIARPFIGSSRRDFVRTANRRDYAVPPPAPTLLDNACKAGRDVISVGKIDDIFAHSGTGRILKGAGNDALFDCMLAGLDILSDGGLLIANFIDFDTAFGHRRDVAGYAAALEAFDARLPSLDAKLRSDDLVIITADHGCDPIWFGTDHTREQIPVLAYGPRLKPGCIGARCTFADVAAAAALHLGIPTTTAGVAF